MARAISVTSSRTSDPATFVLARALRVVIVVAIAGAAIAFVAVSTISYEGLKSRADAFSVDRSAGLSEDEFGGLVLRLRVLGAGLVALAGFLVARRRGVDAYLRDLVIALRSSLRSVSQGLRRAIAAEHPAHLLAFAGVLAAAVVLRLLYLDVPLRYDEATTFNNYASKPLYVALANYSTPNNHLFHTFLVYLSTLLFGDDAWAIRLPALVAGLLLVPATYFFVRALSGKHAALLAAGLVATSSSLIEYSTNARGYAVLALVFVLMLIVATRLARSEGTAAWALLAMLGAIGFYTVPVMLYPFGAVLFWLLLSRNMLGGRGDRLFLGRLAGCVLLTGVLTGVLYAPVVAVSGLSSVTSNEFVTALSWSSFLDSVPESLGETWSAWNRDLPLGVSVVLGVGFVLSLPLAGRLTKLPVPPAVPAVGWSLVLVVLQRIVAPPRAWLFLLPLYLAGSATFLAHALERGALRTRWTSWVVPSAVLALVVGLGLSVASADTVRTSRETGGLLDAPAIASYLEGYLRPGDRLVATGSDAILEYYLRARGLDPAPLLYTAPRGERILLVVNELGGQTIDDLLRDAELDDRYLRAPRLLRRYESATLYEVTQSLS